VADCCHRIVGSPDGQGALEVKTAGHQSAKFWEEGVPYWYESQVIHQLAVTNRQWADVAALIGGQEYRCYRIKRDDDLVQEVIKLEDAFWNSVVERIQPPADGTESSARAL